MRRKTVIVLPTCDPDGWDGGDRVILDGLLRLWPELAAQDLVPGNLVPDGSEEAAVSACDYVVQAGTPAWYSERDRRFWKPLQRLGRPIALLGIGYGMPYTALPWYGSEDFVRLRESGLIEQVVTRDLACYWWLHQQLGMPGGRIQVLPCPGFFAAPARSEPVESKARVMLSIANPDRTSHATEWTFSGYWEKTQRLIALLERVKARVDILYQRAPAPGFLEFVGKIFPGRTINWFTTQEPFYRFMSDHDVYIGCRNHGAMPSAGMGIPALLLGTDDRQHLAAEVPFISRMDISRVPWSPEQVLTWYRSLEPHGISASLIAFRREVEALWRAVLGPLSQRWGMELPPPPPPPPPPEPEPEPVAAPKPSTDAASEEDA